MACIVCLTTLRLVREAYKTKCGATGLISAFHVGLPYWVRNLATYAAKTLILRCFMLKLGNILEKYGEKIFFFKKEIS